MEQLNQIRDIAHEQVSQSTTDQLEERLRALDQGAKRRYYSGYTHEQLRERHKIVSELYCRRKGIESQPHVTYVPWPEESCAA